MVELEMNSIPWIDWNTTHLKRMRISVVEFYFYNCMSTFLHYVHCKDALLDCSAPGGERCESLTWVDEIKDACIEVKTYDKRDASKFEIINYPDLSGNIPTKPAYGVFTSQVIRYARICSKKGDLLERVKSLTKKLLRKHYTINGLKSSLKKCLKKHRWITTKLGPRLHQNLTEE